MKLFLNAKNQEGENYEANVTTCVLSNNSTGCYQIELAQKIATGVRRRKIENLKNFFFPPGHTILFKLQTHYSKQFRCSEPDTPGGFDVLFHFSSLPGTYARQAS